MNDQLKPPGQILLSEKQIQNRIEELGQQITKDYENKAPLLIGVLKGAFVYMADLARAISLPIEFDFMAVSSYGNATKTSGVVRIVKDLDKDLSGRDVIVVEDIIDSGLTLNYLRKNLDSLLRNTQKALKGKRIKESLGKKDTVSYKHLRAHET